MMWPLAFISLTAALMAASVWLRKPDRAVAFLFILCGLCLMAAIRGEAHGWIAFATWTLISYLLLNFPLASMCYLASALLYIAGLHGSYVAAIQVASNMAGLAGLVAVWYGKPRWRYVGYNRFGSWGLVAMAYHAAKGGKGSARAHRKDETT